ncbi:MAG: RpiB/LacA/LacB family sugar-phosphate isomerase [Aridibacter sp.]
MSENKQNREKIRELVKSVLDSVPLEEESSGNLPEHIVVNSLQDKINKEFDRDESAKMLLTEDDFNGLENGAKVRVAENVKFTLLAEDFIKDKNIELVYKTSRNDSLKVKSVGVGCDHGGFEMKEQLKDYLNELGLHVRDFGTNSKDSVDYPDFAHAVAVAVSQNHVDVGIIIDGAGIGSAMAANKVPNVHAAACYNVALARNSRQHNGANVLTLGSGQNSFAEVKEIVMAFLSNEITEERHRKRVGKIDAIERQYKN